jgi:hypothetical protein
MAGNARKLRHRDASKRQRTRVVAQGDPVQCAKGVTRGKRTRRGRDQPLPPRYPVLIYLTTANQRVVSRTDRTTKDTR